MAPKKHSLLDGPTPSKVAKGARAKQPPKKGKTTDDKDKIEALPPDQVKKYEDQWKTFGFHQAQTQPDADASVLPAAVAVSSTSSSSKSSSGTTSSSSSTARTSNSSSNAGNGDRTGDHQKPSTDDVKETPTNDLEVELTKVIIEEYGDTPVGPAAEPIAVASDDECHEKGIMADTKPTLESECTSQPPQPSELPSPPQETGSVDPATDVSVLMKDVLSQLLAHESFQDFRKWAELSSDHFTQHDLDLDADLAKWLSFVRASSMDIDGATANYSKQILNKFPCKLLGVDRAQLVEFSCWYMERNSNRRCHPFCSWLNANHDFDLYKEWLAECAKVTKQYVVRALGHCLWSAYVKHLVEVHGADDEFGTVDLVMNGDPDETLADWSNNFLPSIDWVKQDAVNMNHLRGDGCNIRDIIEYFKKPDITSPWTSINNFIRILNDHEMDSIIAQCRTHPQLSEYKAYYMKHTKGNGSTPTWPWDLEKMDDPWWHIEEFMVWLVPNMKIDSSPDQKVPEQQPPDCHEAHQASSQCVTDGEQQVHDDANSIPSVAVNSSNDDADDVDMQGSDDGSVSPSPNMPCTKRRINSAELDEDFIDETEMDKHSYPLPPTSSHPDINRILKSAAKIYVDRLAERNPDLGEQVRAWPSLMKFGDLFSGCGTFHKLSVALIEALRKKFPMDMRGKEVSHCFQCEIVPWKRRFLLKSVRDPDCCLYTDATELFTAERMCSRHNKCCDLPEELFAFNAGFSCKNFSKLHNDWKDFQRALAEENTEASSVVTFKCVLRLLGNIKVGFFILENVDIDSSGEDSNLDYIFRSLQGAGFNIRAYKMVSTDYASPQRRIRLFFVGISKDKYPAFNLDKIKDILELLTLKCQKPVDFMLPDASTPVLRELNRRTELHERRLKDSDAMPDNPDKDKKAKRDKDKEDKSDKIEDVDKCTGDKWKALHIEQAEKRGLPWPLQLPKGVQSSPWFSCLPQREQENTLFLLDDQKALPTILPGSKMFCADRNRILLGRELLHVQCLQFGNDVLDSFSEPQLTDLAGNGFTATVCMAVLAAILAEVDHCADSDAEAEDDIVQLMSQLKRARHV